MRPTFHCLNEAHNLKAWWNLDCFTKFISGIWRHAIFWGGGVVCNGVIMWDCMGVDRIHRNARWNCINVPVASDDTQEKQQKWWYDVEDFSSVCVRSSVFLVMFRIAPFYKTSRREMWYISARLHNAVSQQTVVITVNDWKHKISQIPFLFLPIPNSSVLVKIDEWNETTSVTCQFCVMNA